MGPKKSAKRKQPEAPSEDASPVKAAKKDTGSAAVVTGSKLIIEHCKQCQAFKVSLMDHLS